MDSGNSGSLQSSSGGDEDYDSRAVDSVSAFMNSGHISNTPPHPQPPPSYFDPLSNYLQLHQNPNSSLLNPSLSWPRTSLRSDPNPITHDIMNPMFSTSAPFSFQAPAAVGEDSNRNQPGPSPAPPPQNQNQTAARNPKKRSRASRRAPTTVLTTDTTNFRAMVQEFTGIPAPPFNNSSFQRARLDLFGTRSTPAQPPAPSYLRRPFAQKIQPQLPVFLSSSASTNNITTPVISSASSSSFQLPITQSSNLFNIQNPLLNSLIQTNPKFPFSNSPTMGSNSNPQTKIGPGLDEQFGLNNLSTSTLNDLPNLIPSDQIAPRNNDNDKVSPNNVDNLRSINGADFINFPRNSLNGVKIMNYSATSTSNFNGEKGTDNVGGRGEGMVESWLCSSE